MGVPIPPPPPMIRNETKFFRDQCNLQGHWIEIPPWDDPEALKGIAEWLFLDDQDRKFLYGRLGKPKPSR